MGGPDVERYYTPSERGWDHETEEAKLRRQIDALRAEVERLERENEKYSAGMQENCALRVEVERLTALIKGAPHGPVCRYTFNGSPCDCWKSRIGGDDADM